MTAYIRIALLVLGCACSVHTAHAETRRYAIVVGSNLGQTSSGVMLPPLRHAEREAEELHEQLLRRCHFAADGQRTLLLTGATRAEVMAAIRQLHAQKAQDTARNGEAESFFALFFTGHGQEGELLLRDGPIAASTLASFFETMNATFSLGFFDACHSGSLHDPMLAPKGAAPVPGLALFSELPEDTLTAEGRIWFVSSAADEASYEDDRLGGVFTHYFIAALKHAPPDGPGIPLSRIWEYTRQRTTEYTARHGRRQTPHLFSQAMNAGALYFSFPAKREASLWVAPEITGQIELAYTAGQYSETHHKTRHLPLELPIFTGRAHVRVTAGGQALQQHTFEITPGARIRLEAKQHRMNKRTFGHTETALWKKGLGADYQLRAVRTTPQLDLQLGLGVAQRWTPRRALAIARQAHGLLRLDYDCWVAQMSLAYGTASAEHPA